MDSISRESGLGHVLLVWRADRKNDIWVQCFDQMAALEEYKNCLLDNHPAAIALRFKVFEMGSLWSDHVEDIHERS